MIVRGDVGVAGTKKRRQPSKPLGGAWNIMNMDRRRWWGLLEGQPAGFIAQCEGECAKFYVLEEGDVDAHGALVNWVCNSALNTPGQHWKHCPGGNRTTTCICYDLEGRPGYQRQCEGTVRKLAQQEALLAAWALGGIDAVVAMVPLRKE